MGESYGRKSRQVIMSGIEVCAGRGFSICWRFAAAGGGVPAALLCFALFATLPAEAHPGIGILMDASGNVFYTDLQNVWKIAPDGNKSIAVRNVHTHELYLDASGNLHGEHLWYESAGGGRWGRYFWRLSPGGQLEKSPPHYGAGSDMSFVRDAAGNMYWFEAGPPAGFIRRAPDGTRTRLAEDAEYRDVRWITATPDGELYFTDDGDLRHLTADGHVITLASRVREQAGQWMGGVWLDTQGRVYVAVWGARVVKRFDPVARRVEVVAHSAAPWAASGGMVAPNGELWLLETSDSNAVRVRRLSADGAERIY